jgi:phage terminase Nu1 subunit (DNA packaging protein)
MESAKPITQHQAAEMMGVTLRHFQRIAADSDAPPKLANVDGKASGFPCKPFGRWLRQRWMAEAGVSQDGTVYDEKMERARLLHHQANNEALKESINRMDLLKAETVERVWSDMIVSFRSKMLGLPSRAAHSVVSLKTPGEVEAVLMSIVTESLCELADSAMSRYSDKIS